MINKIIKINPLFTVILFSTLLFIIMFCSIYSYEKKTIVQNQVSSSVLTMNSISYSINSEIKSTIIEAIRISNFAEDRRYDDIDESRFGFLYSVILYKMREVLHRKPDIGRISLYRDGNIEAETTSDDYIKEDYKTLDELNIMEDGRVIYIKIMKGLSTENIVFMTRVYVSNNPINTERKGTYFDIYNQIELDVHYSSFKSDSSSIAIVSNYSNVEKIVGKIDKDSLDRSVSEFKERVERSPGKTFNINNLVSNVESSEKFKNKNLVICGFRLASNVGVLYIDKYKTSSFSEKIVLKILLICTLFVVLIVLMFWFIKSSYIDRGIEIVSNYLNLIILYPSLDKGDMVKEINNSYSEAINYTKFNHLIKTINILENNVRRRTSALYKLENYDTKTNLPNENELKKKVEKYEKSKTENVYLALFYIQPSEGMSRATFTLMSQVSSIYTQISHEISDIVFEFNDENCGSAKLYRTSSETFSVLAITDSKSNFYALIEHIAKTVTKDRFENNIHFVTPCFCSWMNLDFNSEIKSSYSSKLNRTIEYAVKEGNYIQEFNLEVSNSLAREDDLKFDANDAFKSGEFNLFYQPIFSTSKNIMVGVHVYPRWKHNVHGEINYNEFMPILEKLRIGDKAQKWFINESLREVNEWRKSGYRKLDVYIRISQIQMTSKSFVLDLETMAMENSIDNSQINILLSAETFESQSDVIKSNINNLSKKRFKIAINNYGAPYNTPSVIGFSDFKVDKIILNKDSIDNLKNVHKDKNIIEPLLEMCNYFGVAISCNAVEDIELARTIAKSGVAEISGNCLVRPIEEFSLKSYFDFNIKNRLNI